MSDLQQHNALVLITVALFFFLTVAAIDAIRDAFTRANRTIDLAQAMCRKPPDPIDAHYDTTIREVPISAELRADFSRWEREVAS